MIKEKLKKILMAVGLDGPARKVWHWMFPPDEHGHALMIELIKVRGPHEKNAGGLCIEIGSTRELLPGQGSTAKLAEVCVSGGLKFVTVDMDPENTERAKDTLAEVSSEFTAVNQKGEEYLASINDQVDYLYLDAFDFDHEWHSEKRRNKYREHLGTDIDDEACYKMHLDCAVEAVRLMPLGSIIVFDDVWQEDAGWGGKGKTAVPHLLKNGFVIVKTSKTTVALRRDTRSA